MLPIHSNDETTFLMSLNLAVFVTSGSPTNHATEGRPAVLPKHQITDAEGYGWALAELLQQQGESFPLASFIFEDPSDLEDRIDSFERLGMDTTPQQEALKVTRAKTVWHNPADGLAALAHLRETLDASLLDARAGESTDAMAKALASDLEIVTAMLEKAQVQHQSFHLRVLD